MMQIVYFSQKAQLWDHWKNLTGEVQFITPSPAKADSLRLQLGAAGVAGDVITIAKFTSNLVEQLWPQDERPEVKRKADLLLIFGILKNQYLPELGFEQFMQGYNLFSDLRSYSMDEDALSSVIEEQSPEIQQAVNLFWKLLNLTGFLDEHGAYHKIAEGVRSSEEIDEFKKIFVFWGFSHMSGQQVDLLKALAIRYQVVIPFPMDLKDSLKRSDWISWLRDHKVEEIESPRLARNLKAKWLKVNSRELALNLKEQVRDGDQVVLGVSKLTPLHIDLVPSSKVSFKVPLQLIEPEIIHLSSDIKLEFGRDKKLSDLKSYLLQKKQEILKKKKPSFKALKAVELYVDGLAVIEELTDTDLSMDDFFQKLLGTVVALNQPRTSFVPVSSEELTIDLKDMGSLEHLDRRRRSLLCIDDRFEDILGLSQNYTESVQKHLSTLGPIKRGELELSFRSWELKDLISEGEVLILMNESTLKHSLIWKKLFAGIEFDIIETQPRVSNRRLLDHFQTLEKKSFTGNFSASKFQSFIDCPRRFYFSYIDKVFPSLALEHDFDSLISGTISHRIIELFHKRSLSLEALPALTTEVMTEMIRERGLHLPRETYLKRQLEFNHRAQNGILFLEQLAEALGEKIVWRMEEEFSFTEDYKVTGKIDAIGESQESVFLIDFKSTGFSVASQKEIVNMDNLQLWTYAQAASRSLKDFASKNIVLGFVSLDKPADSRLMVTSHDHDSSLKAAKICKYDVFETNFPELLKESQERMNSLALAIKSEKDFLAIPRAPKSCHFCELTKVCVKSQVPHE